MCNALVECLPDWTTLGIFLEIEKYQIDSIDGKEPYSNLLLNMLDYWLRNSKDCSWEALVKAVEDVGNVRLARQLSKEFLENK